jgi:orotidine-5'-phosphate decarboxylase
MPTPTLDAQKIILALDTPSSSQAASWLAELFPPLTHAKIGLELFTRQGPEIFHKLKKDDVEFFLDLKLHDIPHTISRTITSLSHLPIKFLTVHATGGLSMLKAACEAAQGTKMQLLAVTILTSLDQEQAASIFHRISSISDQVLRLAEIAAKAGITGFVCSPQEIIPLRSALGSSFTLITPGIRPRFSNKQSDDQQRTLTAKEALAAGADYLVIGRPITHAPSPQDALARLLTDS